MLRRLSLTTPTSPDDPFCLNSAGLFYGQLDDPRLPPMFCRVVVVGAGASGLSAAACLRARGEDGVVILERWGGCSRFGDIREYCLWVVHHGN